LYRQAARARPAVRYTSARNGAADAKVPKGGTMKARCWLVTAAVLSLLPAAARAQGLTGRFTIAAQVGTQSEVSGNILQSATGTLLDRTVTIDSVRYRDVYAPALRLQLLLGYGIGERTEIVARTSWYESEWTGVEAGNLDGDPLFAFFEPFNYEELGFEVGFRYYLASQARLKSYIAPVVGVRFLNEILVSYSAQEAGSSIRFIPFSKEGAVPVFGLDIGFTFDLGERFYVGMDTGIRYQSAPGEFDYLPGLGALDDSSGRWSAPVVAVLGVRF
jgi:hypothetical protein